MKKIIFGVLYLVLFFGTVTQVMAACTGGSFGMDSRDGSCSQQGLYGGSGSCGVNCVCCRSTPSTANTPVPATCRGTCIATNSCSSEGLYDASGTCSSNRQCCGDPIPPPPTATRVPPTPTPACRCDNCSYLCNGVGTARVTCLLTGSQCDTTATCGGTPYTVSSSLCTSGSGGGCVALSCTTACDAGTKAACGGQCGSTDNCGGVSCASCSGPAVPTSAPGCTPNCLGAACRTSTCWNQTCSDCGQNCYGSVASTNPLAPSLLSPINSTILAPGVIPLDWADTASWGQCPGTRTYQLCVGTNATDPCSGGTVVSGIVNTTTLYSYTQMTGGSYYWKVGTNNGTGLPVVYSPVANFIVNVTPTLTSFVLKNNVNGTVTAETGNRNQICQSVFNDSRTINATINASDADGNITDIQLRWNGISMTRTSLVGGVANFSYTFNDTQNNSGIFDFQTNITDAVGATTGWINVGRTFKVWSCDVPVSGTIFDGSLGQSCNTTGFSVSAGANMGYTSTLYKNMNGGVDGTNSLLWGDVYLPLINGGTVAVPDGDLQATGRFTRLIDTGVGTTICPSASQFDLTTVVSPYSVSPGIVVDMSFVQNQENWFQGRGVDIKAKNQITSGVPQMANTFLSVDNLSIGTSNNGLISSSVYTNTNGNNDGSFGMPNDWHITRSLSDNKKFSYETLLNDYYNKLGEGSTNVTNIGTGSTGVLFVNGNLNIDSDVVVEAGKYLIVVSEGSINIGIGASRVDGIYIANGGINAMGDTDSQLIINGILYGSNGSNIRLSRSFATKSLNNLTPSVIVNYRPELIFELPGKLNKLFSGWMEN